LNNLDKNNGMAIFSKLVCTHWQGICVNPEVLSSNEWEELAIVLNTLLCFFFFLEHIPWYLNLGFPQGSEDQAIKLLAEFAKKRGSSSFVKWNSPLSSLPDQGAAFNSLATGYIIPRQS
jgi:hypothetical protein